MSTTSIRKSTQEKVSAMGYDLFTLELWEAAEAQGIDSSEGGSFGLDTRMFNPLQKLEWRQDKSKFVTQDVPPHLKVFNYFRYPVGKVVELDPMLEAVHHSPE